MAILLWFRKLPAIVVVPPVLVGGFISGWIWHQATSDHTSVHIIRQQGTEYHYIQPLLAVGDDARFRQYPTIEKHIAQIADHWISTGKVDDVSVYFKDFASSHWGGYHEDDIYALASLHKIAVMLAILKQAEMRPQLLLTAVTYEGGSRLDYGNETNTSPDPIEKGKSYPIADLLRRMIVYSDNNAKDLLFLVVDQDILKKTYSDLGLPALNVNNPGDTTSPKSFSLFFRVLYNSSYLTRDLSEAALSLLSQTTFLDGLVAGVPPKTPVAHKFGFRDLPDNDLQELHDCGIIYKPNQPYLLCVMTRGKNSTDLAGLIQAVSRSLYEEIGQAQYREE